MKTMCLISSDHATTLFFFFYSLCLSLFRLSKSWKALVLWINSTLKAEHIVVQSLEEDLYDGLVLHHLLSKLTHLSLTQSEGFKQ